MRVSPSLRLLIVFVVRTSNGFRAPATSWSVPPRFDSLTPHSHHSSAQRRRHVQELRVAKNSGDEFESLRPTTSFGSEAVPEGQRPVNEYLDVTKQPLFGWAATGTMGLLTRLVVFYSAIFGLVCYPISGATFTQDGYLLQKLTASSVGAAFVILLLMIRLYSGWGYIGQRLSSKVIEYEETGWFDGDWEEKTEIELKRDRMLFNSEVKPVVDRLKVFTIGSGGLLLASILSYNVAISAKPMFNQYDPSMLERLSYDDKLADSAATYTGGRPAYCDSRYYSAVANGGQGCK
jgi:hypothetical protein